MEYWVRRCVNVGWPLISGLVLASVALGGFAGLAHEVWEQESLGFDHAILNALYSLASPALTAIAVIVTDSATPYFLAALILALAIFWWPRQRLNLFALVVVLGGSMALNFAVKTFFARARPAFHPALVQVTGSSFPSGHSMVAFAFYGTLAYLVARQLAPRLRIWPYLLAGMWIALVGLSRIYLEVHFPSDVIAAFAIDLPWVLAVIFLHQCLAPPVRGQEKAIEPVAARVT